MVDLLQVVSAAGDAGTGVLALMLVIQHRRVSRIERKLWPDVFGG